MKQVSTRCGVGFLVLVIFCWSSISMFLSAQYLSSITETAWKVLVPVVQNTGGISTSHETLLVDPRDNTGNHGVRLAMSPNDTTTLPFPRLLVPFFVYDNGLNWENATIWNQPVGSVLYPSTRPLIHFKHATDYWLLQAARHHPLRTKDPNQAKLFYVPTLMNLLFEMKHSKSRMGLAMDLCVHGICGMDALMEYSNRLLGESKWFRQSGGYDHILVSSHSDSDAAYTKSKIYYTKHHRDNLWETSKIIFEDRFRFDKKNGDPPRHHLSHLYVAHGCTPTTTTTTGTTVSTTTTATTTTTTTKMKKTFDFAMVASLHQHQTNPIIKARFQSRRDLCDWLIMRNYSVSVCGEGDQCPALGQSRYGFHVRGDTWGANRLQDTILSSTVPIFTEERQYQILPPFLPWRDLSELVELKNASFHDSLATLLQQPLDVYRTKLQRVMQYQPVLDLVHSPEMAFDWYMAEFAQRMKFQ